MNASIPVYTVREDCKLNEIGIDFEIYLLMRILDLQVSFAFMCLSQRPQWNLPNSHLPEDSYTDGEMLLLIAKRKN